MRIRALYIAELIVTAGMATIFLLQTIPFKHTFIHWTACIGASILYLLAAHRFLARMFFSEQLLLDEYSLTIIKKTLLSQHVSRYDWRHIGALHYAGKGTKTDHPLKGKCFDYFGFETQEHLIQSLHHDGNMYFDSTEEPCLLCLRCLLLGCRRNSAHDEVIHRCQSPTRSGVEGDVAGVEKHPKPLKGLSHFITMIMLYEVSICSALVYVFSAATLKSTNRKQDSVRQNTF